jgi:glucokinase
MHDVCAAAMAEGPVGAASGASDYRLITLGTGVGAAMMIGGRPYTGAHGFGGELGHVAAEPRAPVCGCGRPGCPEAFASAGHIALANYVTLRDPQLIVIGGSMSAARDDLFGPLRPRLQAQVRFGNPPVVVRARLGEEAGRYGVAIGAWRATGIDEAQLSGWKAPR